MKNRFLLIIIIAVATTLLMISGCGNKEVTLSKSTTSKSGVGGTFPTDVKQELGIALIEKQSLVAVYDNDMDIPLGSTKKNYFILKNAYKTSQKFMIQFDCELCMLSDGNTEITIDPDKAKILEFVVGVNEPGSFKHNIIITDANNNFYANQNFNVLAR